MPTAGSIRELELVDDLYRLADEYAGLHGYPPEDISHWNPKDGYARAIAQFLDGRFDQFLTDYVYSYDLNDHSQIIENFGLKPELHCALFTPSGTTSINCIAHWLKAHGFECVVITCPHYFAITYACRAAGLDVQHCFLDHDTAGFRLPPGIERALAPRSALWITNPVYNSSSLLHADDVQSIQRLLENGTTVIADECLAMPGQEVSHRLTATRTFFGYYSPHKAIGVNGLKFSVILASREHQSFLESWADVQYGGLPASATAAIRHFLGPRFRQATDHAANLFASSHATLQKVVGITSEAFIDSNPRNLFVTCYLPWLSHERGYDRPFLRNAIFSTGTLFIPGIRSYFPARCGLTFRVNLARCDSLVTGAIGRLLGYCAGQVN